MSQASVPDQSERSSDELIALASNEKRVDPGDRWYWPKQPDAFPEPVQEWRGPMAFSKAYGSIPGIERDFGSRWGANGDQRVSLRVEVGSDTGLLYVYDPTWDEYAVIGSDVPLAAVEDAFALASRLGEHAAVEDFVSLLPSVHPDHRSPGPER
jgi:hypothetical protein